MVRERTALLGTLKGDLESGVAPYVEYSNLGAAILQEETQKINHYYPQVEVLKLCMMPDHLHMIVSVKENMGEAFDACAQGMLLQISPWDFHVQKKVITRAQCLYLNALAEKISAGAI